MYFFVILHWCKLTSDRVRIVADARLIARWKNCAVYDMSVNPVKSWKE